MNFYRHMNRLKILDNENKGNKDKIKKLTSTYNGNQHKEEGM